MHVLPLTLDDHSASMKLKMRKTFISAMDADSLKLFVILLAIFCEDIYCSAVERTTKRMFAKQREYSGDAHISAAEMR